MRLHAIALICSVLSLSACATRTFSTVAPVAGASQPAPPPGFTYSASQNQFVPTTAFPPWIKSPNSILVTSDDITDRPYRAIGDITVSIAKWTLINRDPTPEDINEALQSKAAELGADAVVLARYGGVGIGVITWSKIQGKGRAIVFTN